MGPGCGETGSSWIIPITNENDHHPFCFLCYAKTVFEISMHVRKSVSKKREMKAIGTRNLELIGGRQIEGDLF